MICEAILLGALGSVIYYGANLDKITIKSEKKDIVMWKLSAPIFPGSWEPLVLL